MKEQNLSAIKRLQIKAFNYRFQICRAMLIISSAYILLSLFPITVLVAFAVLFSSAFLILFFKFRLVKQKGIINSLSPKVQDLLTKRSIYDIYRDQVYYPYFTKIIGVFLKGAITKPHPEKLDQLFQELPQNVRKAIFTKGVLHLAPDRVEKLILQKQVDFLNQLQKEGDRVQNQALVPIIPKQYGKIDPKWDKLAQYSVQKYKIHQQTISKQMLLKLNDRINSNHIILLAGLVGLTLKLTKGKKLGKILLYNGSVAGIFLLIGMIVIKFKQPQKPEKKYKKLEEYLK